MKNKTIFGIFVCGTILILVLYMLYGRTLYFRAKENMEGKGFEDKFKSKELNIDDLKSKNDIYVLSRAGCNNKIRYTIGFKMIGDRLNKPVTVVWDKDNYACRGTWSDVFTDIPGVNIIDKPIPNKEFDASGEEMYQKLLNDSFKESNEEKLNKEACSYMNIKPDIEFEVDNFVRNNNIDKRTAIHIRGTDFIHYAKQRNTDPWTIDRVKYQMRLFKDANEKVLLLTDDPKIQKISKEIMGKNLVYYKELNEKESEQNFRPTTFKESFIEILIASRAKKFLGTKFSSFSDTIELYRECNGKRNTKRI